MRNARTRCVIKKKKNNAEKYNNNKNEEIQANMRIYAKIFGIIKIINAIKFP